MPRFFRRKCKDCNKSFSFTAEILSGEILRGLSPPERCSPCRNKNSQFVKSSGSAYWIAPIENDDDKRCWGHFGFGQLERGNVNVKEVIYKGVDPNSPPEKFQKIQKVADRLIENLENPSGKQFSVVVAPTGTGKSTWLPYRILRSKCGEKGRVLVTSPRKAPLREDIEAAEATSVPGYIARELCGAPGVGAGQEVGILFKGQGAQHDKYSRLLFITDGLLIRFLVEENLDNYSVIFVDEAHEQSKNMEVIFALLKRKATLYPNLRIVIASATIDTEKFVNFFGNGNVDDVFLAIPDEENSSTPHEIFFHEFENLNKDENGVQIFKPPQKPKEMPLAAANVVRRICIEPMFTNSNNPMGDIVVFIPTVELVKSTVSAITNLNLKNVEVFACHAQLDKKESRKLLQSEGRASSAQQKEQPTQPQRIIVATDYIKTSMTLPNLRYIVDSGYSMDPSWDSQTASFQYIPDISSKADCKQRAGRVGRIQSGEYFPLFDDELKQSMPEFSTPEIGRVPLDVTLLSASVAGIDDLEEFDWLGSQSIQDGEVKRAISALKSRGAIDEAGQLTITGTELSTIQVDTVDAARAISDSDRFGCALEVASFMAFVSLQRTLFNKNNAQDLMAFANLRIGCFDDFEFYLRLLSFFNNKNFIEKYQLDPSIGKEILSLRDEYLSNYTRRTHTSISDREIDFSNLDKARFIIAQSSKEWIYRASDNPIHSDTFSPLFPAQCPYQGVIKIDQDSSCAASGNISVMMCVKRSRVGKSEAVFGEHIVKLREEWLPLLSSISIFEIAQLFQNTRLSPETAKELSQRINNIDSLSLTHKQLALGGIDLIVVRVISDDNNAISTREDNVQSAIVAVQESNNAYLAHIFGFGNERIKIGEHYRLHLTKQIKNEIWLSLGPIKASYEVGTILSDAKLLAQLTDDEEYVYGWLFQLEPGVKGRLYRKNGCDRESLSNLASAEAGDNFELVVKSNNGESIELETRIHFEAATKIFNSGDYVEGKLVEKTKYSDGGVSGCNIQLLPGREGFLSTRDICGPKDLSIAILSKWRKGSKIPVIVKKVSSQNKISLSLDWDEIYEGAIINGYVNSFLEQNYPNVGYDGVFIRISHKNDGFLHRTAFGNLDISELKIGSKLTVRVTSIQHVRNKIKYGLQLY